MHNPYTQPFPGDADGNGPAARRARLAQHLAVTDPVVILVAEAPGCQGATTSGIAMTSERLLLDGSIPRVPSPGRRLSQRARPWSEPTATVVWRALYALDLAEKAVLWNSVQLHPHKPGKPHSNRAPTREEVRLGRPALLVLGEAFPRANFVAVGQHAERALHEAGLPIRAMIRHPSYGGAPAFAAGLAQAVA